MVRARHEKRTRACVKESVGCPSGRKMKQGTTKTVIVECGEERHGEGGSYRGRMERSCAVEETLSSKRPTRPELDEGRKKKKNIYRIFQGQFCKRKCYGSVHDYSPRRKEHKSRSYLRVWGIVTMVNETLYVYV